MPFYDSKYHPSPFYSKIPTCVDNIFFIFYLDLFILSDCSLCATSTIFLSRVVLHPPSLCLTFASICLSIVMTKNDRKTFFAYYFLGKVRMGKEQQPKTNCVCVWGEGGKISFEEDISFYHLGRKEDRTIHTVYLGGTFWMPLLTLLFLLVCFSFFIVL